MKAIFGISLSVLVLLGGCAGMSEADCLGLDWEQIGLEDGQNGKDISEINRLQEGCAKYGVEVDGDAYEQGYNAGLRTFCQAENGFEVGKSGYQYTGICPADLSSEFLAEYNVGVQFYYVYRDISALENRISQNHTAIGKLESGISTNTLRLDSDDLGVQEETSLRQGIESMESQITEIERTAVQLQAALHQRQGDLESLSNTYRR